ncbi:MAG: flavodoxin family protein [Candidatus Gastranaerophilaceae bacterium]|nr:flavodoxin family protein [Candidatus Gastranaerophilaceae bacterium]
MKKVIILNASPRKNFNTAKLLKNAQNGAESAGAVTEYFNLYDYNFLGCRSCFACQRKGSTTDGVCAIKDDIRPILEKCIDADALIIGTPVYFSYPTGVFRSFTERLLFANHTYMVDKEKGGLKRRLDKIIPTGIIFTMNCPEELARQINYHIILDENIKSYNHIMGYAEGLYSYDTTQFADFSKYNCDLFDENHKKAVQQTQFPVDLENAFNLGSKLAKMDV